VGHLFVSSNFSSWSYYNSAGSFQNPIVKPVSGWDSADVGVPAAVKDGSTYYMIYSGGNGTTYALGLATSTDGHTWTKYGSNPVISKTVSGCNAIDGQSLIVDQPGVLRLFARGGSGACTSTSSDGGKTWSAMANPSGLLSNSEVLNGIHGVAKDKNVYKMWYAVLGPSSQKYATSSDGITWIQSPSNPVATGSPYAVIWDPVAKEFRGMLDCYNTSTNSMQWCLAHRP
jgi:predicted GH43/DUF377 family glycosyl hydrolase